MSARLLVSSMPEFQVENLTFRHRERAILSRLTFDVEPGEFVCILGPSGAGKSSVLKQLNRLTAPTEGCVRWRGKDLARYDVHALRRSVAYVFQKAVMFEGSVRDNILLGAKFTPDLDEAEKLRRFEGAVAAAEVPAALFDAKAQTLSGGEQQRVGIARTLMLEPDVLLLDEPTASLDVETSAKFCHTLNEMKQRSGGKRTFVMVTHRLAEAQLLADRILMLDAGAMVEYTAAEQFFRAPVTERARSYLAAERLND